MNKTLVNNGARVVLSVVLCCALPSWGQELGVLRVQSLDRALDGAEAVAHAAGHDLDRSTILASALGAMGIDESGLIDMGRPMAVGLPVEGMMLQKNGFVAAVPVTDVTAALAAMEGRFANHSVEEGLHTFGTDEGPIFYARERDGYLLVGGNSDLVAGFDPLSVQTSGSTIALELFLEPVAPMIQAGLQAARQQVKTQMEQTAGSQEMPFNPEAMAEMVDLYLDGLKSLVENTRSFRVTLDVGGGTCFSPSR